MAVDQIKSEAGSKRLKVIVCGGGIAGFAAAALLREEHDVVVLEQSDSNVELGAAVTFSMNASRLLRTSLKRAGFDEKRARCVEADMFQELNYKDLSVLVEWPMSILTEKYGDPWWYFSRADVHEELKRAALSADGLGTPARVELGAEVASVDADTGAVNLKDGRVFHADVVVGADGIRSPSGKSVFPGKLKTVDGQFSAYRCMIKSDRMRKDAIVAPLVDCAKVVMLVAPDRRIVAYPCSSWELMNFVCIFPDDRPRTEQWSTKVEVRQMMDAFADFHPAIVRMLSWAVDTGVWKLLDREPLDNLVKDKFVLTGDAAHAVGPHQGQGACQAIEDAEALRVVLHGCTDPNEVPSRLAVFSELRVPRVAKVIEYTREMAPRRANDPRGAIKEHRPTQMYSDYYWSYHMTSEAVKLMNEKGYDLRVVDKGTGELNVIQTDGPLPVS